MTSRIDELGKNDVTVIVEWTPVRGLTYNVTIIPPAAVRIIGNSSAEVTVPYNTLYNVSIVPYFCDERGTAMILNLNFGEFAAQCMIDDESYNY